MFEIVRLALLGLALPTSPTASTDGRVVVHGQGTELGETPIVVPVGRTFDTGNYWMKADGRSVAASVFQDGEARYLGAVLPSVPASGERTFELAPVLDRAKSHPGIELIDSPDAVEVRLHAGPFATYLAHAGPKPYYFPVVGPTRREFTRAFPMRDVPGEKRDHPHQRSLWFTHGKVNGIDFWSELKGHGSIVETSRKIVRAGYVLGEIRTTDDWVGPDGTVVLSDNRVARFFDTEAARLIDFTVILKATHGPVTIGDTKEGMFGLRVPTSMDVTSKGGGKIVNAAGLTDEAAWGKPAEWVDYSGPVDGETVGIAILDHPSSFRHPTTWHVRTYGLFAANPFGWHDFGLTESGDHRISAGESIRFAYRVILHKGDAGAAGIATDYAGFARPPVVEVKSE